MASTSAATRRRLLSGVGVALTASVAGCSEPGETTTTTREPPESTTLRIRVENHDTTIHDATFRLLVTTDDADRYELFEVADLAAGEQRTLDDRELPAGEYELEIDLPLGTPTIRWTASECVEKLVVVRFTESGFEISGRCPSAE